MYICTLYMYIHPERMKMNLLYKKNPNTLARDKATQHIHCMHTNTHTHKGTTTTLTKSHTHHHIHDTHNNIYVCIGTVTAHTVIYTSNTLTCNYTPQ